MKELSLNILDITQNSISAGATHITIALTEEENGRLTLVIADNGCGMTEEVLRRVSDPFYTTRTTRKVGMGISLLTLAAEQTGGGVTITSVHESVDPVGHGTTLTATFDTRSIDFPPLGDMVETLSVIIQGHPEIDYSFRHITPTRTVSLETSELREVLGEDVSLAEYEVMQWIESYLREQYSGGDGGEAETV
ncbi:MAG: sensor histidine kinase [Ruminococcaceae bacterium]|nr:sensor histidine kinase [Oscillospiraceae bacterium]